MSDAMEDPVAVARHGGRERLARALADERARLLRLWSAYHRALAAGHFEVRYLPELNPPLWELGHVAWFEEFWLARNPQRLLGVAADPEVTRAASLLPQADALYNSSRVAHTRRWHLDLPDDQRTLAYAARVRERTLALLRDAAEDDAALYFYRLALQHEAMHAEAWVYMAQTLGIALAGEEGERLGPGAVTADGEWAVPAHTHTLGSEPAGFAFDNELPAHPVALGDYTIDRGAVTWRRYLPFVEAGGYDDEQFWTPEGWAWRRQHGKPRPLHLMPAEAPAEGWQQARFGQWLPLDLDEPAMHLSQHEALAWCRWAGRRLPTEAEWEAASTGAEAAGEAFDWGRVWEWTASPFTPFADFEPHPYRDYSMPWIDGRPVLRGASFATSPRLAHARYRNFFPASRNDIFGGFRSCAA